MLHEVFLHPALKKAKAAIKKANLFTHREKRFVQLPQVEDMMAYALGHQECMPLAMLFLMTYTFLLRLPSEALPAKAGPCQGRDSST